MEQTPRKILQEKLKRKTSARRNAKNNNIPPQPPSENMDFSSMINQVQSILQKNPDMVQKVNTCMKSILSNKDLMNSLSSQIQTLDTSASNVSNGALSEDKQ